MKGLKILLLSRGKCLILTDEDHGIEVSRDYPGSKSWSVCKVRFHPNDGWIAVRGGLFSCDFQSRETALEYAMMKALQALKIA